MTYKIKFVVRSGGQIESTVEGIKGPSCLQKTAWLDNLGTVVKHEDTPEAFELAEEIEETEDETETVSAGDYDW